jgi:hypothetical protein
MGYVGLLNLVLGRRPCLLLYPSLLVVGVRLDHDLIRGPCGHRGHLDDPYPFYPRPLVYPSPFYHRLLVYPFDHPSPYLF